MDWSCSSTGGEGEGWLKLLVLDKVCLCLCLSVHVYVYVRVPILTMKHLNQQCADFIYLCLPHHSLFSSPFLSSLSLSSSHLLPFSSLPFPSITSSLALPCHSTHSASDCGAAEGPLSSVSGRLPPQGPALAEPLAHTGCPCALRAAPPGGVLSPTSQHVRTGEAESQGVEGDMHASCSCSFVC